MTRLVAIGIGSHIFGIELLRDIFQTPELRGAELWLVDVDRAALEPMTALARRLEAASGWDVSIHPTTEREEALPGADFVVTSVAVDRDATWQLDHELALRHGFGSVDSENGGPGGLSHTLRSIPLMLGIVRDVERLAPAATMLQYTNPENRVALAIRRHTRVRSVGLCHGVAYTRAWMADLLGRPLERLDVHAAGVNHFTWVLAARDADTGEDLLPAFEARLADLPEDARLTEADGLRLSRTLFERFGIFPTTGDLHVGEYIGYAAEVIGTDGWPWDWATARRERARRNVALWAAGEKPVEPLLAKPSHEARVNHSASHMIGDILAGRTSRRPSFILPNEGYIDNVEPDVAVEVPGLITEGRARGVPVGPLPEGVAAMVNNEIAIQKLAVEAALTGSRELALQALLIDPVVHSLAAAEAFLDDVLAAHRRYLPAFWSA
jgi:alpha-galactosidase